MDHRMLETEPYLMGFMERPQRSRFGRWALAARRFFELAPLPGYDGGPLYPCGDKFAGRRPAVWPDFSFTFAADWDRLAAMAAEDPAWAAPAEALQREAERIAPLPPVHTVGGAGYTHAIPAYDRVLREGLNGYRARVESLSPGGFQTGLGDVLAGAEALRARCLAAVGAWDAPDATRLAAALARVPHEPARTFYEALVCWNFIFYLDGCDDPGRLDPFLAPYYDADVAAGRLTRKEAVALVRVFFLNVDANWAWSAAVGGSDARGNPAYHELTGVLLEAAHGLRRPSLELRVRRDMPDALLDDALACIATGGGQPALYNEEAYLSGLRAAFPELADGDLCQWNGGGCTETMIHGCACVGSLDAGINLMDLLCTALRDRLPAAGSFGEFYNAFCADMAGPILSVLEAVSRNQREKAEFRPQPVRTLLIDDCLDRGLDFFAGGARYNWSIVNLAGLINAADSLLALRDVVFEKAEMDAPTFLNALWGQGPDHDRLMARLRRAPHFGVDDAGADVLAADFTNRVCDLFDKTRPWRGGRFLPASIQFITYAQSGRALPATPDGREAGDPLADSVGAIHGKDDRGPTALLRSVARLPLKRMLGTPILNLRFMPALFQNPGSRAALKTLIRSFFEAGGLQMQLTVVDRDALMDALVHPERHGDLIVRVGGYSEYFNRLSEELKRTVVERTEHGVV